MPDETPQIYLITPPSFDLASFAPRLASVLDGVDIACLRLDLASDADAIARAADALRDLAHARNVPIVIDRHVGLVDRHGLDGAHLRDGRGLRSLRAELGPDAILGAACGTSRHDGMNAGDAGADYVAFGPVGETGLGDGTLAPRDLFAWWSEMIEVPVIAEGGMTTDLVDTFAPVVDFFAVGLEIWRDDDPVRALRDLTAPLR
ncbi:MAG: thiamine phosphate synthase [Pseudomonadota bacterium]